MQQKSVNIIKSRNIIKLFLGFLAVAQIQIVKASNSYDTIIDAYTKLEESGYKEFDEEILGDSILVKNEGRTFNFGGEQLPILKYALFDVNRDGVKELFIGSSNSILGIYTIQNDKPVSVLQVKSAANLVLLIDNNGDCVMKHSWGHMGYAEEFFYTINKDGDLILLDGLYTDGDDLDENGIMVGHFRTKDAEGKKVSITEEEYCSLISKYGSTGYEPFEEMGEERKIDLKWIPILTSEITADEISIILSAKNIDVIKQFNITDTDNRSHIDSEWFYKPVFLEKSHRVCISFGGSRFDDIDTIIQLNETPLEVIPIQGTTIDFNSQFSFCVGDNIEDFIERYGAGHFTIYSGLDELTYHLKYKIEDLEIEFTSYSEDFSDYTMVFIKY